jgi:hypothetical protein
MDGHLPACRGFWLWALPGAMLCFSALSALSIGIFVAPFAALAVIAVSRWDARRGVRGAAVGSVTGMGLTVLGIGLLHLGNTQCLAHGAMPPGATECEEFDPTPWLLAGSLMVVVSIAAFALARRQK